MADLEMMVKTALHRCDQVVRGEGHCTITVHMTSNKHYLLMIPGSQEVTRRQISDALAAWQCDIYCVSGQSIREDRLGSETTGLREIFVAYATDGDEEAAAVGEVKRDDDANYLGFQPVELDSEVSEQLEKAFGDLLPAKKLSSEQRQQRRKKLLRLPPQELRIMVVDAATGNIIAKNAEFVQ